ncbi:hypothetical protein N7G274_010835, partial [Stereocaulon virgatum]
FIHLTAKEFLQNFYDSPILQRFQAQLTVSLSCVLYLTSSLDLVDPRVADNEKRSQVALCLHELHLYANDHWLDHLRALAEISERLFAQRQSLSPLRCSLDTLAHVHNELLPSGYHNTEDDHEPISSEEVRWESLGISSAAQSLLNQTSIYRDNVSATGGLLANDDGGAVDNQDPSLFTSIRTRYLGIVEGLLGSQESEGACLDGFRARHLSGTFFCRYRNCIRFTQGFNAPELREAHEKSHLPQFRCTEPQCISLLDGQFKKTVREIESEDLPLGPWVEPQLSLQPVFQQQSDANAIHLSGVEGDKVRFVSNVYILSRHIY